MPATKYAIKERCKFCGGECRVYGTDRNRFVASCVRCHRETAELPSYNQAVSAWNRAMHIPAGRDRENVMEQIVSKDPYHVQVVREKGESKVRLIAWCMTLMDVRDAKGLIKELTDAVDMIENGTEDSA